MARGGWSGMRPGAFGDVIEKAAKEQVKEIAAFAFQQVIFASPVDQGAYKANHRITVNGETLDFDPNQFDPNGQRTLSEGQSVIDSISGPFVELVIQNNIPYGEALENGSSQQAPGGVYGIAFNSTRERFS